MELDQALLNSLFDQQASVKRLALESESVHLRTWAANYDSSGISPPDESEFARKIDLMRVSGEVMSEATFEIVVIVMIHSHATACFRDGDFNGALSSMMMTATELGHFTGGQSARTKAAKRRANGRIDQLSKRAIIEYAKAHKLENCKSHEAAGRVLKAANLAQVSDRVLVSYATEYRALMKIWRASTVANLIEDMYAEAQKVINDPHKASSDEVAAAQSVVYKCESLAKRKLELVITNELGKAVWAIPAWDTTILRDLQSSQ